MKEHEKLLLEDAIECAIEAEKKIVTYKAIVASLSFVCVALLCTLFVICYYG